MYLKFDPGRFYKVGEVWWWKERVLFRFLQRFLWVFGIFLFCDIEEWVVNRKYYVVSTELYHDNAILFENFLDIFTLFSPSNPYTTVTPIENGRFVA